MGPHREEFFFSLSLNQKKNRIVNNLIPTDAKSGMTRLRADLGPFYMCFWKAQGGVSIKRYLLHACVPSFEKNKSLKAL